jgi:hypothetical protein
LVLRIKVLKNEKTITSWNSVTSSVSVLKTSFHLV